MTEQQGLARGGLSRLQIAGLALLKRRCDLVFYSDSSYLTKGMKEWIHGWARRGWKRKGGRIENLELWTELVRLAARHTIEWRWVRGHAGDPKNEYVNQLAVEAARGQKDSGGLVQSEFDTWLQAEQDRGRYLEFFDLAPDAPFDPDPTPPDPPA